MDLIKFFKEKKMPKAVKAVKELKKRMKEEQSKKNDEQKSAEVLDAIKQEARNQAEAREEYCFLFGHYYKEEDFWDYYYNEFCK